MVRLTNWFQSMASKIVLGTFSTVLMIQEEVEIDMSHAKWVMIYESYSLNLNFKCRTQEIVWPKSTSLKDKLSSMISQSDLVISLLPYVFHPNVAKIAIENK